MLGAPDFLGSEYVEHSKNGLGYAVKGNTPPEIYKQLKKQVVDYNKRYVAHLNRSEYGGYLRVNKDGVIYLSPSAPDVIKQHFSLDIS